jgi:hypothetical protein
MAEAKGVLRFVLHRRRCALRSRGRGSGACEVKRKFTEPVALLSTRPADLPLPRTAVRRSFNLLALRARCEQEPTHASLEGQDGPARDYRTLRRFSNRASERLPCFAGTMSSPSHRRGCSQPPGQGTPATAPTAHPRPAAGPDPPWSSARARGYFQARGPGHGA